MLWKVKTTNNSSRFFSRLAPRDDGTNHLCVRFRLQVSTRLQSCRALCSANAYLSLPFNCVRPFSPFMRFPAVGSPRLFTNRLPTDTGPGLKNRPPLLTGFQGSDLHWYIHCPARIPAGNV